MLNQIKIDLARDLNCQPSEVHLIRETKDRGQNVRWMRINNEGYKVTTDPEDQNYVNIEPFNLDQPTHHATIYNDPIDFKEMDRMHNIYRTSMDPQEKEGVRIWFSNRGMTIPTDEDIDNIINGNFRTNVIPTDNLPNTPESVIKALGLSGFRLTQTANYKENTIRIFMNDTGRTHITLQNSRHIKDITDAYLENFTDNFREAMEGRFNGRMEHDLNILLPYLNNHEEDFILGCLVAALHCNMESPILDLIEDLQKLLSIETVNVQETDNAEWMIYPEDRGEDLFHCKFRVRFKSLPQGRDPWWGLEAIVD